MIYVVDRRNRDAYGPQLEEMFRIRHRIYVDGRKWTALARADGREIDAYDGGNAVYLLGLDDAGRVTGGLRLVPTTGPHLMRDVFAHAVIWGPLPGNPRVYEFTRYFLTEEPDAKANRRRESGKLLSAMFEYGLAARLTQFSLVCDTFFMPTMLELGWKVRPLGIPVTYDEGTCIAVTFEITEAVLLSTRAARGVAGPCLTFSPAPPPEAIGDATRIAP